MMVRRLITGIVIVIAVALIVASFVNIPYYALTPGRAQSVEPLIGVPAPLNHDNKGRIDLVDVEVTPLKAIDWLWFHLNSHATIVPSSSLQGPESSAQYNTEGVLDMESAQQAATIVALNELGYPVSYRADGALVYELDPGSPANAALVVGDVVVGVDSVHVSGPAQFSSALAPYGLGATVRISFRSYPSGKSESALIRLGTWRLAGKGNNSQVVCLPFGQESSDQPLIKVGGGLGVPAKGQQVKPASCLGILDSEQSFDISKLPFKVNLNSEGIIGPSAGLAFTLGLIQKLDPENLTAGLQVAATGTMSITGQVGAIGGIEQKTFAVRSAGVAIFLVPAANYAQALQYAGPTLKVYSVSTIGQAISILLKHGGKLKKAVAS